ncbi:MAG: 3-dehydroquinate synthase [Bryobacteraceae bacterium]
MPSFRVAAAHHSYPVVVERGIVGRAAKYVPDKAGKVFIVSTEDVWRHHGDALARAFDGRAHEVLFLPGTEEQKRLEPLEELAEKMVERGGDRSSVIVAFGGGIVNDMGGFLAAIFMRGIPVVQVPTTLLAQVDASIGGKTAVNLRSGKNMIGSFHPPAAVLIDPAVLDTLPEREFRSGLWEIVKAGIIRETALFDYLAEHSADVLARRPQAVDHIIAESVRMKVEVVGADERDGDLRRILNFGHTFGHALETETAYKRLVHGEAVGFGMRAATWLGEMAGYCPAPEAARIHELIRLYGPIPPLGGIAADRLVALLVHDKKTVQGKVNFVLPVKVGQVTVVSEVDPALVREAIVFALS